MTKNDEAGSMARELPPRTLFSSIAKVFADKSGEIIGTVLVGLLGLLATGVGSALPAVRSWLWAALVRAGQWLFTDSHATHWMVMLLLMAGVLSAVLVVRSLIRAVRPAEREAEITALIDQLHAAAIMQEELRHSLMTAEQKALAAGQKAQDAEAKSRRDTADYEAARDSAVRAAKQIVLEKERFQSALAQAVHAREAQVVELTDRLRAAEQDVSRLTADYGASRDAEARAAELIMLEKEKVRRAEAESRSLRARLAATDKKVEESTSAVRALLDQQALQKKEAQRVESPPPLSLTSDTWPDVLQQLELLGAARMLAERCIFIMYADDVVRLGLDQKNRPFKNAATVERLEANLSKYLRKSVRVEIV